MQSGQVKPTTLEELRGSGWVSKTVKREIHDNFLRMLRDGGELFPSIIGYDDTVIPEINIALIAQHDMLFLGEKGQAKSRLMRLLVQFLDEVIPYLDIPGCPVHEDPYRPITAAGKRVVAERPENEIPVAWWPRQHRYAERLSPGTKFADIIGEIDPAKLASGTSMSAEDALHFGLIPRMHRGIFAMNELPELDELVQVGLIVVHGRNRPVYMPGQLKSRCAVTASDIENPEWAGVRFTPLFRLRRSQHVQSLFGQTAVSGIETGQRCIEKFVEEF